MTRRSKGVATKVANNTNEYISWTTFTSEANRSTLDSNRRRSHISDVYSIRTPIRNGVKEKKLRLKIVFRDKIVKKNCQTVDDNKIITGTSSKQLLFSDSFSRMLLNKKAKKNPYHPLVNTHLLRTFIISAFVFFNCCTTSVHCQAPLPPAGFLDFDNLPVTRFSCEGKVIGGYYADVETGCQMFHVCTLGQKDEIQDIKFLCLNGTVFDQETRVCERVDEVDCSKAEQYFDLNLDLYVPHATTKKPDETDVNEDAIVESAATKSKVTTTTTTTSTTTTPILPRSTTSPRTHPPSTSSNPRNPPVISSSHPENNESDNNGYTSFNYYLKTPHSHVASGYNSQSRQSYIINQPGPSIGLSTSSSHSSSSSGRKVPSGQKTIVYTSSSTSSSTARPKTVVVVKATLPLPISTQKSKPGTSQHLPTTSTAQPFEVDEHYDEYYDEEDYPEQPSSPSTPSSKQSMFQNQRSTVQTNFPLNSKQSPVSVGYDFRDGRSAKGETNAGSIVNKGSENKRREGSTSPLKKLPPQPSSLEAPEIVGNSSTEEPYYYEDDYPDDVLLQQQQLQNTQYPPSSSVKGTYISGSASTGSEPLTTSVPNKLSNGHQNNKEKQPSSLSTDSEYYDDDNENVNAHDHHFTHVDVPRIPYAKPNVPRVLVTNGKPFLPRLRRQSLHNRYSQQHYRYQLTDILLPTTGPMRKLSQPKHYNQHGNNENSMELRREARSKAMKWGKDYFR